MQGRDDVAGFIAGFAGDDRYIVDYLVGRGPAAPAGHRPELPAGDLHPRPADRPAVRRGHRPGRAARRRWRRWIAANLFLVPLDDRRRWYRYHHLFADVLRARLLDEQPDLVAAAAPARERRGSSSTANAAEAIRHALAAADFERAAGLIELAIPATEPGPPGGHAASVARGAPRRTWSGMRPVLCNAYAGSFLVRGETDGVEERLRDAERWLDAAAELSTGRPAQDGRRGRGCASGSCPWRRHPSGRTGQAPGRRGRHDDATPAGRWNWFPTMATWHAGPQRPSWGCHCWTPRGPRGGGSLLRGCDGDLERAGYHSDVLGLALTLADIQLAHGRPWGCARPYRAGYPDLRRTWVAAAPRHGGHAVGMSSIHHETR